MNEAMDFFPKSGRIMDSVPPPQLHIYLGFFNGMYDKIDALDSALARWWAGDSYTVREAYHGGCFEGNECRRLLNLSNSLRTKVLEKIAVRDAAEMKETDDSLEKILELLDVLDAFKLVVVSCFGWKLRGDYEGAIQDLRKKYLALSGKPSVTLKMHIVFEHVASWCKEHGRGLGLVSEQSLESIHANYAASNHHPMKDTRNPRWAEKQRMSLLEWNALSCIP